MRRLPRPAAAAVALERAQRLVEDPHLENVRHGYVWGGGNFAPAPIAAGGFLDAPWTTNALGSGCDCYGLITWAFMLPRHRPGYNHGAWSTVADDANCDSAIEDAEHEQDLWTLVTDAPRPGDIVVWPSVYHAGERVRIGHVALVESVARVAEWPWATPAFELLDVIQVRGPEDRKPAAIRSDGALWNRRDRILGGVYPQHRTRVLRSVR